MDTKSFKETRKQCTDDDDLLVLVDRETRELPTGELEVTGAKNVHPYKSGKEMYDAYKDLSKKMPNVYFVPPQYKDSFKMEQRYSMCVGEQ